VIRERVARAHLLAPFTVASFRCLWFGQALSSIGDGIFPVALALQVLSGHGSGAVLGYVLGVRSAATLLTVLFGGVIADRMRRTRLMALADAARGCAVLGFALAPVDAPLPPLLLCAAVMGIGAALFRPAYGALLPTLLPAGMFEAGNAAISTTSRLALIVGPGLGGVLTATIGARWAFAIDAVTFAASLLTLVAIREARVSSSGRRSMLVQAWEGLTALRQHPWVGAVNASGLVQVLFVVAPATLLLPLWLHGRMATTAYGAMLALQAAGSVTGALAAARWRPRHPGAVALCGPMTIAGQLLAMAVGAPIAVLGAAMFVSGLGTAQFIVHWRSALQREIPRELLGRIFSLDYLGSGALEPAGLALTAPAIARFGFDAVAYTALIVLFVSATMPLLAPGAIDFRNPRAVTSGDPSRPQAGSPSTE
jgi:MFS family permease